MRDRVLKAILREAIGFIQSVPKPDAPSVELARRMQALLDELAPGSHQEALLEIAQHSPITVEFVAAVYGLPDCEPATLRAAVASDSGRAAFFGVWTLLDVDYAAALLEEVKRRE